MRKVRKGLTAQIVAMGALATPPLFYYSCQKSDDKAEPKIIGGFDVDETSDFGPLMSSTVAVTDSHSLFNGRSFCSGTLVGRNTVMTAAHCFTNDDGSESTRRAYIYFGNRVGQQGTVSARQVVEVVRHPEYDNDLTTRPERRSQAAHDLALVRFAGEAPANYEPVSIAKKQDELPEDVVLAGFGTTGTLLRDRSDNIVRNQEGQALSKSDTGTLRAVEVKARSVFTGGSVFFVSGANGEVQGACPGDSGGPAYFQTESGWKVTGALSTGLTGLVDLNGDGRLDANCTGQNFYTDLRDYEDWISSVKLQFGEEDDAGKPDPEPEPQPEPEPEPVEPPSDDRTNKVYWIVSSLGDAFTNPSGKVGLQFYNDTAQALENCLVRATIESTRAFFFWRIRINDLLTSGSVPQLPVDKITELEVDLNEVEGWQRRRFETVKAQLICNGKIIPLEELDLEAQR